MKTNRRLRWGFWLGVGVSLLATIYVIGLYLLKNSPRPLLLTKTQLTGSDLAFYQPVLDVHIICSAIVLLLAPYLLADRFRKNINVHKAFGLVYAGLIFLNVPVGAYLALYATGGVNSTVAFFVLILLWFGTTLLGVKNGIARKRQAHKAWMWRSYAVTLVFVTFRIVVSVISFAFHLSLAWAFPLGLYVSMILNLLIANWLLARKDKKANRSQSDALPN